MINNKSVVIVYNANGSSSEYEFPFKAFSQDEVNVYINDTLIKTGYTVELTPSEDNEGCGGKVVFADTPTTNTEVMIKRNMKIERLHDFQEGGDFRSEDINQELDYQTSYIQQVEYTLSQAITLKDNVRQTSSDEVNMQIPTPKDGSMLVWRKTEQGIGLELQNADLIVEASNEAHDYAVICQDVYE